VYYKGTFIGKSFIDPNTLNDTLELSMGRDNNVIVERKKVDDYSKTTVAGSNKKTQLGLKVTIRNNKPTPITIRLEDQIPISKRKEIVVDAINTGDAEYDEKTGKLLWIITLQPGETTVKEFRYSVKYPKDKTIPNL